MGVALAPLWLLFVVTLLCLPTSFEQDVPAIACPQYFQYLQYGNQYIGKIFAPVVPAGTGELFVEVKFSQRAPVRGNYYGRISTFDNEQTTLNNLRHGNPIAYRVDFPLPNVLPKLTSLVVNGYEVCSATGYPPPNTKIELQNRLQASTQIVVNPLNSESNTINSVPSFSIRPPQNRNPTRNQSQLPNAVGPADNFAPFRPQPQPAQPAPIQPQLQPQATESRQQPQAASPDLNSICGVVGNTVQPFLYGGAVIARGQYPWLTAIYKKEATGVVFICGGSLISSRTVVTAAHCFQVTGLSAQRVVVYLGRHNLESYSENGVVARDVSSLVIHEDYNTEAFPDADLAVLHLQAPVSFSQYITPICLWNETPDIRLVQGQKAYVAGWGEDEYGKKVSPLPKVVDANIVNNEQCLRSGGEIYSKLTSPRTICAGNLDGTGPCLGDSGGGLMINRNGRWMLRGIVSAGQTGHSPSAQRCKLTDYVIYCDLAKHITWVQRNML